MSTVGTMTGCGGRRGPGPGSRASLGRSATASTRTETLASGGAATGPVITLARSKIIIKNEKKSYKIDVLKTYFSFL